jgi:hypothetical protein
MRSNYLWFGQALRAVSEHYLKLLNKREMATGMPEPVGPEAELSPANGPLKPQLAIEILRNCL